jgi:ribosomal protein S18 acetylase RimI-like enzyme
MKKYSEINQQTIIINDQTFILRAAEDSDYEFVFNLLKENMLDSFQRNWGFWNDKSFEENYHKENIRIIENKNIEHENLNVGYIDFKFKIDCGYINNIQLSENIRDKGLGTYIMKMLEKETLNHGLKKIRLKVFKDNIAVKLYQRLGYTPISEDTSSLIMEKIL